MKEHQSDKNHPEIDQDLHEVFPLFKTWRGLYMFVLGELVVLIILFYLFSRTFA